MSKPKYDKETLKQLKDLSQDERLTKLEEDNLHANEAYSGLLARLDNYESRIKTLEDARQVQIKLNIQAQDNFNELMDTPPKPKPSFWDIFK